MTFKYTKTVKVDFSSIIDMDEIADVIMNMLCDSLDYEIWGESKQSEIFETITKEAYRYVTKELNEMVE